MLARGKEANQELIFAYVVIGGKALVNTELTLLTCTILDDYCVVPCEAVSLAHLLVALKKHFPDIGVVLVQASGHLGVLRFAADHCFFKLKLPQLQNSSEHLRLAQPNPDIASHIGVLLKKVIEGICDAAVEEILKLR